MSNQTGSSSLGMAWYTFYVKVRPWIGFAFFLLGAVAYGGTFLTLMNISLVGAALAVPTIVYVIAYATHTIASLVLFFKERKGSLGTLLGFIKGLLIFEIFFIPYNSVLSQYYNGQDIVDCSVIMLILVILSYFIWYKLNIKYFRKRLVPKFINDTMPKEVPEGETTIDSVGYSLSYTNEVPKKSGTWDIMGADLKVEKRNEEEFPKPAPKPEPSHQEIPVVTKEVEPQASYTKYCSKCGKGINPVTKVCTGCGKQYFKGLPWKTLGFAMAIVLLVASVGLNVYMYSNNSKMQAELTKKKNESAVNITKIKSLTKENSDLKDYIAELETEKEQYYDVFDSLIVFIEDDGTKLYHKYDCDRFPFQNWWAHNIDYAKYLGYKPCPRCCN